MRKDQLDKNYLSKTFLILEVSIKKSLMNLKWKVKNILSFLNKLSFDPDPYFLLKNFTLNLNTSYFFIFAERDTYKSKIIVVR